MADRRSTVHGQGGVRPRTGPSRPLRIAAALAAGAILLIQLPVLLEAASRPDFNGYAGIDYELYMRATRRWLGGGHFYEPYQLAGPYLIGPGDILYPPVALVLFAPFVLLPAVLWWAIPLGATLLVLVLLRPSIMVWPLMAACLGWQPGQIHIISGNPVMWAMAAVALGTIFKWPSVFALIKPSLFVFAVFGARNRTWWYGLGLFAALSALFLPLWPDWLSAVLNSRGGGLFYSWQEAPLLALPIIAWLGRPQGRYGHGERRAAVAELPGEVQVAQ